MDRLNPRFFNIDYWVLRTIRKYLEDFLARRGARYRGGTALDFGAADSPYRPMFAAALAASNSGGKRGNVWEAMMILPARR
jgi:hypothetical protein